jgi:hypothetical protein
MFKHVCTFSSYSLNAPPALTVLQRSGGDLLHGRESHDRRRRRSLRRPHHNLSRRRAVTAVWHDVWGAARHASATNPHVRDPRAGSLAGRVLRVAATVAVRRHPRAAATAMVRAAAMPRRARCGSAHNAAAFVSRGARHSRAAAPAARRGHQAARVGPPLDDDVRRDYEPERPQHARVERQNRELRGEARLRGPRVRAAAGVSHEGGAEAKEHNGQRGAREAARRGQLRRARRPGRVRVPGTRVERARGGAGGRCTRSREARCAH